LALVATDVGGCREVLDGGAAGMLVQPGVEEGLAGAFEELSRDGERRAALGRRARERICRRYSLDAMAELYGRLYDGLLPHGG
jgi:glycosyltransferase involved in cell wall biosynthesis